MPRTADQVHSELVAFENKVAGSSSPEAILGCLVWEQSGLVVTTTNATTGRDELVLDKSGVL